ncbi:beta-1,6-N-acetylglucosaminyltransferase [Microcoleus sp. B4-D4]|uniref:beta-1,6-N-acetylglucosaminyltransferase n=1 Tax=Microcoleus sp. B4-D4 TaxID=2818667 RepID=UPI002FD3FC41
MKICYFIQTHQNPQQIYRLVRTIKKSSPNSQILINHNFNRCDLDLTPLQELSDVHLLTNQEYLIRADFSCQVEPYLNAIDWLFANNSDFDWLINLTGQDYPTQPLSKTEDFLAKTNSDGFIRYWDVLAEGIPWETQKGFKRYYCRYWRIPGRWSYSFLKEFQQLSAVQKLTPLQFYLSYGPLVGIPRRSTLFSDRFICYGGWAWYTLSRKCAAYIKDFVNTRPDFVDYYQKTVVPEESFIQTILVNNKNLNLVNDDKRYIDYTNAIAGSPRTLTVQDYATITNGNFHFARKFDIKQDAEILDKLDSLIFT